MLSKVLLTPKPLGSHLKSESQRLRLNLEAGSELGNELPCESKILFLGVFVNTGHKVNKQQEKKN